MRILLCLLLPAAALAQQTAVIQVPAWPGKEDGPLRAESLTASVGGAPATILNVMAPDDDLMLLVVLDVTGDLSLVEEARKALIERINALPPNHFVGVLQAQNGLKVLAAPTPDRPTATGAIRSHAVGGLPGLLNTIEAAARLGGAVIGKAGVRLAILYLTDSRIEDYRENYTNSVVNSSDKGDLSRQFSDVLVRERVSRLVTSLAATQAPVFITHLSYNTDRLNEAYQTGLLALARATGGSASFSRSQAEISFSIGKTLDRILAHYSVRIALPDPKATKAEVTLVGPHTGQMDYRSTYELH